MTPRRKAAPTGTISLSKSIPRKCHGGTTATAAAKGRPLLPQKATQPPRMTLWAALAGVGLGRLAAASGWCPSPSTATGRSTGRG